MANVIEYVPYGGVKVKKGSTYSSSDLPTGVSVVKLCIGERIVDARGELTPLRGVWVTIENNGLTPPAVPLPNSAFIWKEGDIIKFITGATYTFQTDGVVSYGNEVIL